MTTNPRDAARAAFAEILRRVPEDIIDALCPPGGRVVVERTTKPCARCEGRGRWYIKNDWHWCSTCEGSGVVEATTIHGLEEAEGLEDDAWHYETLFRLVEAHPQ